MDEELTRKLAEHDLLIKEIPTLRESVHKQDITNEKILNKMDRLSLGLDSVNIRLDKMDKNFETEKDKTQISWTSAIKNGLIKALEVGVAVLIALAATGKNIF